MLDTHWAAPGPLWECLSLLARLVGNVAGCGNSIEKYRTIKATNTKVRVQGSG